MKRPEIGNLAAWITGVELNLYQKADAVIEFNKLLDYVQYLEKENKCDRVNDHNANRCINFGAKAGHECQLEVSHIASENS